MSPIHGRERRLIGEGAPGFRNIKSVSNISFIPEYSKEQLDDILSSRLKNKMEMLNNRDRQILAACKNYDAYLIKDPETKEPIGFKSYFPPSSVITDIKTNRSQNLTNINASGIAFCGENIIKKVIICMQDELNNKQCKKAKIREVKDSGNKFVFWDSSFDYNNSANNKIKITSVAVDTNKDKSQNRGSEIPNVNARGLYWHGSKAVKSVTVSQDENKSSDQNSAKHPIISGSNIASKDKRVITSHNAFNSFYDFKHFKEFSFNASSPEKE